MPLPTGGGLWPPADIRPYIDQAEAAMAWWSGDPTALAATSNQGAATGRRKFWQRRKESDATTQTNLVHVPIAADIATVASDLLFGDGFGLNTADEAAQGVLENLEESIGLVNILAEGAEWASASGGVYLRAAWDKTVSDGPLSVVIPQNQAVPDFRWGQLAAVTLWRNVMEDNGDVYRLLERHEPGAVMSELYKGSKNDLGSPIGLNYLPQTQGVEPAIILPDRFKGRLLVNYVPNVRPNRPLPWLPLGRPDWQGCEPMLDALDEVWTSLMRDIRLAAAHVIIPQEWLKLTGVRPGQATTLDMDAEVFTSFNIEEQPNAAPFRPELMQPAIRVTDHIDAALAIIDRIVSTAGYSPQTFGLKIEGSAESGTALRVRENKTDNTQKKKRRYWQPQIRHHGQTLLDIGAEVFGTPTIEDPEKTPLKVTWPEPIDPVEQATLIQSLRAAQAVSIHTAVKMAQPELEDAAVDAEVALIEGETSMPDPTLVGIEDPNAPPVDPNAPPVDPTKPPAKDEPPAKP